MLDTSLNSFHFYFVVATIQGFILAIVIGFKQPKNTSNVTLAILLFICSLSLIGGVLEESFHAFNAKFPFPLNYQFLFGPFAYFHVRSILDPKFKLNAKVLIHLLPSLLFDVLFFSGFFLYLGQHMDWAYDNIQAIQFTFVLLMLMAVIQWTIYGLYIVKILRKAVIKPAELNVSIRRWLMMFRALGLGLTLILGIAAVSILLNIELLESSEHTIYSSIGVAASICIYALGYVYLLKYSSVIEKYRDRLLRITLSPDEIQDRKMLLQNTMLEKKLYRDEKLTPTTLAAHLGWAQRDVAMVLQESFDTNFNDFVNSHRVTAFQELAVLPENAKYSILGIAQEVGFNSKASFYRAFKKVTGQTPTEFLSSKKS